MWRECHGETYRDTLQNIMRDIAHDVHIQKVRDNCKKKVNQLHSVISNRDINLTARRLLLLSVVRPSLEYGSEIWDCNKSQARALESIILGGAKNVRATRGRYTDLLSFDFCQLYIIIV